MDRLKTSLTVHTVPCDGPIKYIKNDLKDDNHLCVKLTASRGIQKDFFSVTTQLYELSIDNRPSRHVPAPEKAE